MAKKPAKQIPIKKVKPEVNKKLLAACKEFICLFRESDMRPYDECHDLYLKMQEAVRLAEK